MPTKPYHTSDGARVLGVTTILGRFKDSGGLIHWAWDCGVKGLDYRQIRDEAAAQGTAAHKLVEDQIRGRPIDLSSVDEKTATAYRAFLQWAKSTRLTTVETEVSLVSERYRFGGTLDGMLIHGELALGDWKTSNAIYPEYLCQLAAYGVLWEENFSDRPILSGYHLLRFSKENLDFSHHFYAELTQARRAFLLMAELYPIMAALKKRAA